MRLGIPLLLFLAGCTGLRPLPAPSGRTCDRSSLETFWDCLQDGNRPPSREASAFTSTIRMYRGDFRRKLRDQRPGAACSVRPPDSRFTAISGLEAFGSGVPGQAFYFPGDTGRPAVIVVHGLFDSKASRYVTVTARFLADRGFGVLVPDMRWHGCLLSPEPQGFSTLGLAEARDLVDWSRWLSERVEGGRPVGLVGYSLGALDVIHAMSLGEAPSRFAAGGIAVSPPGDLERAVDRLDRPVYLRDQGLAAFFLYNFRQSLRSRVRAQRLALPGGEAEGRFHRIVRYLAETAGSPEIPGTPQELLEAAQPGPRIRAARVPLLILATRDDPIFTEAAAVDLQTAAADNPYVRVVETPHGGHIGQPGLYPEWMAETVERFFGGSAPRLKAGT